MKKKVLFLALAAALVFAVLAVGGVFAVDDCEMLRRNNPEMYEICREYDPKLDSGDLQVDPDGVFIGVVDPQPVGDVNPIMNPYNTGRTHEKPAQQPHNELPQREKPEYQTPK